MRFNQSIFPSVFVVMMALGVRDDIEAHAGCLHAELTPPSGLGIDGWGRSVAIHGDRAIVGAPYSHLSCGYCENGAAVVFRREGDTWIYEALLVPPDVRSGRMGGAVALSDDLAACGADEDNERGPNAGAVYLFRRIGSNWTFEQKLTTSVSYARYLGSSVAVDGDVVVAGAARGETYGGAYVFRRKEGIWVEEAQLRPLTGSWGSFGRSVDVQGDTIACGMPGDDVTSCNGCDYGSVSVFRFDGTKWRLQRKIQPMVPVYGEGFGSSVHLMGHELAVGVREGWNRHDAAYFFFWSGTEWSQHDHVVSALEEFGSNVRLANGLALVGARSAIYAFPIDSDNEEWSDEPAFSLTIPEYHTWLSSMDADEMFVIAGTISEKVFMFALEGSNCHSDCNQNGQDDAADMFKGSSTDCNGDGTIDECDPDCDENSVPDNCEGDCNGNNIVDACDIQNGTSPDCSGDGLPDECEDRDCNANGVPDSCDIYSGYSGDEDLDTIPDECESWTQCVAGSGRFDYGRHRANAHAEIMAMIIAGELRAPDALYDRMDRDMALMETMYPILKTVGRWREGTRSMYVHLDPEIPWDGFHALNEFYQAVSIVPSQYNPNARHITFCDALNILVLRELYQALPEITYTEGGVNSPCDWAWDCISVETNGEDFGYHYSNGGGDCPSGCTCHQIWQLATTPSGEVQLHSYDPGPSWCDVPNDGDFDGDGLIDYEDPCPAGEVALGDDADADGVSDQCDACLNTIPGLKVDLRGCPPWFPGDSDRDGDIDLSDFANVAQCLNHSGPFYPPFYSSCSTPGADPDNDMDLKDVSAIQRCFSGANSPVSADCK